jgi:hypothetical protein
VSQALHDFAVYGAFATVIAATFFPGSDPSARLLARVLTRATLEGWGWRLAFLVTLPLGLVGLYLRRRLDETPAVPGRPRNGPSSGGRSPRWFAATRVAC